MAEKHLSDSVYDGSGQITSTGSADAYVIGIAQQLNGYYQGMPQIRFKANFTNSGAATANIVTQNAPAGLGAVTLKKAAGATDLIGGEIVSGGVYTLSHDGTNFQVLELNGPSGGSVAAEDVTFTPAGNIAATDVQAAIQELDTEKQPLDGDLTSLAAASTTGDIYYRSAADTWSPVTIDASLSFAAGTLAVSPSGGSPFSSIVIQAFTASDTYTPTAGMAYCIIEVQAPGGGGGGADAVTAPDNCAGAGGGGGEYARGAFSAATIGAGQTVTIGSPGAAGSAAGAGTGGTGGTTSVGALITAVGGSGGAGMNTDGGSSNGGAGGTGGSGGSFRIPGQTGQNGFAQASNVVAFVLWSGDGGDSFLGKGGRGSFAFDSAGQDGRNYGGGGSGATDDDTSGSAGGAGGAGIVIITEYIA
jgi:hypothetical protein